MKLGIILSQTEPETVFNALRLANYSLKQGDTVKIFLVGKGVELDQINDAQFNVREQAQAVLDAGGQFSGLRHVSQAARIGSFGDLPAFHAQRPPRDRPGFRPAADVLKP